MEIEDIDRNGAFVGHVYVNKKNLAGACCMSSWDASPHSTAAGLVEEGLARVHFSADKYKNFIELSLLEVRRRL